MSDFLKSSTENIKNQKCSRSQQKLFPFPQNDYAKQPCQPQNKQKRQQIFAAFVNSVEKFYINRNVHILHPFYQLLNQWAEFWDRCV
jgi:hypothetical protein